MAGFDDVEKAAKLLRAGGVVAFPTETVYGLGANALDAAAVKRVYEIKGRPSASPLIVHVASLEMARTLVSRWPSEADALAERYWPGPLTLILSKHHNVPDVVTAGLDTVGLRVPAHPLALALIREAGVPIAAPSANRFGELSPTTASHVRDAFGEGVDLIVDGGPSNVGIESTVVSLVEDRPMLLRPGMISREDIERIVGPLGSPSARAGSHPAPGMHARHYSPRTKMVLVQGGRLPPNGRGAYLWIQSKAGAEVSVPMPREAEAYAATIYETLHRLDGAGLDWIAVECPPDSPEWEGILDRLQRASKGRAAVRVRQEPA